VVDSGSLQSQQFIYTNLNPYGMNAEVLREGRAERYLFNVAINVLDETSLSVWSENNLVFLPQLPTENSLCGFGLGNPDARSLQHTDQVVQQVLTGHEGQSLGILEISEGLAFGGKILANVAAAWGSASLVAILAAAAIGFGVSRRLIAPLAELTTVTGQMSAGNLTARSQARSRDEFGILGRSFNEMADRIEELVGTLKRFIADAAHELHTPLTTLQMNLDLAIEDPKNRGQYLERAQTQVTRLQTLVDSLLDLSRFEAGKTTRKIIQLSQLVKETAEKFIPLAERAGISFSLEPVPGGVGINASETQLRRALDNILDNAIKFTPAGGSVSLGLTADGQSAQITVKDTGMGIPPEDIPLLFRRFHRGRNAAAFPGNGLGLAIAKVIIDQHGGALEIDSDSRGTTARISIPRE